MVNPAAIEKARQGKRHALDAIYGVLSLDAPRTTTEGSLADLLRVPKQDLRNLRLDLVAVGALRTRLTSEGRLGRSMEWTLVDPKDAARDKLVALWARQDRTTDERMASLAARRRTDTPRPAASAPPSTDPTVAIVGEDAPKPFAGLAVERYDEPRALVEAARQFAGLHREVDKRLKELEALGITVNRDQIQRTIQLPKDDRLAAIADALPYIEQLERTNERLSNAVADLRGKLGNLPELQQRLNRLSSQNERLVSEKVALEARLRDRGTNGAYSSPQASRPSAVTAAAPGK